ncbi:MAG: SMP-30/gluconolactonase/LRE family protein [Sedimentisphaerales bacterium]|nr:SMP-30/gluconolactonase/LRE family protein [Sedimentisphaerales bacterium]
MKTRTKWIVCLTLIAVWIAGCGGAVSMEPKIGVLLPEAYNTPDGMTLGPDHSIYVNCPNFNDDSHPAKVIKISPQNEISEVVELPVHPETGKAGPLGIDFGPDGHLYIADNQSMCGFSDHKSRLLRVVMREGKAIAVQVLATGFLQSNAVSCHGDSVYVTETSLDLNASPMPSGVYRFRYSEFRGEPIQLQPGGTDPHLIVKFYTSNETWRVGANGMGFDKSGNLLVCNFGDASLLKFRFGPDGNVRSHEVVAKGQGMESTDGLKVCPKTGMVYIADFAGNAVHKVDPSTGQVTTLWKNENNSGGVGGLLDRPSEVCLRDDKIYVANIDLPMEGNEYDAPHTLSVLPLR